MTRSAALGREHRVTLEQGDLRYYETGAGRPVVFVHGILTNAELWRAVVPGVAAAGFRCLAPDWPLGGHEVPMRPDAELGPVGIADLIAEFLEALDLRDVILVANDTGGALTQIMLASGARSASGASCSCRRTASSTSSRRSSSRCRRSPRMPGAMRLIAAVLRVRALHPLPFVLGWVAKRPVPTQIAESYLWPPGRSAGVRRDLRKLLRGVHPRHTLAAAERLRTFDRAGAAAVGQRGEAVPDPVGAPTRRAAARRPRRRGRGHLHLRLRGPARRLVRHVVEFANAMAD